MWRYCTSWISRDVIKLFANGVWGDGKVCISSPFQTNVLFAQKEGKTVKLIIYSPTKVSLLIKNTWFSDVDPTKTDVLHTMIIFRLCFTL